MRSMQWQLGMLGTVSAFACRHGEPRKALAEMAGRRTFRILICSQQSWNSSKNSNTHIVNAPFVIPVIFGVPVIKNFGLSGRRTFRILISSQQSCNSSKNSNTHIVNAPFVIHVTFGGPVIKNFAFKYVLVPRWPPELVMPQVNKIEWDRKAVSRLQSLLYPREQNTSRLSIFQLLRCRSTEGQRYWHWDMSWPGSKAISRTVNTYSLYARGQTVKSFRPNANQTKAVEVEVQQHLFG